MCEVTSVITDQETHGVIKDKAKSRVLFTHTGLLYKDGPRKVGDWHIKYSLFGTILRVRRVRELQITQ